MPDVGPKKNLAKTGHPKSGQKIWLVGQKSHTFFFQFQKKKKAKIFCWLAKFFCLSSAVNYLLFLTYYKTLNRMNTLFLPFPHNKKKKNRSFFFVGQPFFFFLLQKTVFLFFLFQRKKGPTKANRANIWHSLGGGGAIRKRNYKLQRKEKRYPRKINPPPPQALISPHPPTPPHPSVNFIPAHQSPP